MKLVAVGACVLSIVAAKVVGSVYSGELLRFVGVNSMFLYGNDAWWLLAVRYASVFICGMIGSWKIVLNPMFVASLAKDTNDVVFIACLCVLLRFVKPVVAFLLLAGLRQVVVDPEPSVSCLWLLDTHFYTDFRWAARVTVVLLELTSIFFARHFENSQEISVLIYSIFEPVSDWVSISFLFSFLLDWLNTDLIANIGILCVVCGIVFNQAAFYTWWTLKTGNANFTMIGSLVYSLGLLVLIYDRCQNYTKKKSE